MTDPGATVGGVNAGFSILLGYVVSWQSIGTGVSLTSGAKLNSILF